MGEFCQQVTVWNKQTKESNLIRNMIQYVDDNFTADISLTKLAKQLNYNYSYMTAEFLRIMGMSFMDYVNNCRVNHACYLLKNTKLSITDIAHESGYQSIRIKLLSFVCLFHTVTCRQNSPTILYTRAFAKKTLSALYILLKLKKSQKYLL